MKKLNKKKVITLYYTLLRNERKLCKSHLNNMNFKSHIKEYALFKQFSFLFFPNKIKKIIRPLTELIIVIMNENQRNKKY